MYKSYQHRHQINHHQYEPIITCYTNVCRTPHVVTGLDVKLRDVLRVTAVCKFQWTRELLDSSWKRRSGRWKNVRRTRLYTLNATWRQYVAKCIYNLLPLVVAAHYTERWKAKTTFWAQNGRKAIVRNTTILWLRRWAERAESDCDVVYTRPSKSTTVSEPAPHVVRPPSSDVYNT